MSARASQIAALATTSVVCTNRRFQVSTPKIKAMASVVCARLGVAEHELSIRLVGSRTIRRLNREFRHIDKATDVLSFPQIDWTAPVPLQAAKNGGRAKAKRAPCGLEVLGDLVISLPDAATNAARIGQPLARELGFLLVHGILHLCGYDHMNSRDELRMRKAQRVLMRALSGPSGGKPLWSSSVKPRPKRRTNAN